MKKFAKHFLKVLLAAMVASMTVTGITVSLKLRL